MKWYWSLTLLPCRFLRTNVWSNVIKPVEQQNPLWMAILEVSWSSIPIVSLCGAIKKNPQQASLVLLYPKGFGSPSARNNKQKLKRTASHKEQSHLALRRAKAIITSNVSQCLWLNRSEWTQPRKVLDGLGLSPGDFANFFLTVLTTKGSSSPGSRHLFVLHSRLPNCRLCWVQSSPLVWGTSLKHLKTHPRDIALHCSSTFHPPFRNW